MSDRRDEIDPALVDRINREHLIETKIVPADLLFVFGTRHGVAAFVAEASSLWHRGFYRHAIVSGGATLGDPDSEAAVIKRQMMESGVPGHIILTEDSAMNTGENVINSLPILERHVGLSNIRSLIAVGKFWTSRRYLMTLQRHWPDVEKMFVPVDWLGVPKREWHLHPTMRMKVMKEYAKIDPYLERGFIAAWPQER